MARLERRRPRYRRADGQLSSELLTRDDEARLESSSTVGPGASTPTVSCSGSSEAQRIRLAHLFDPVLAVHSSQVDPLPHQITAVYEAMLPRQPLRFLLADDPGAGKTIMAGLLIKELITRGDLKRCLIVCPGSLAEQWQDELYRRFDLPFEIVTNDNLEAARTGNYFLEHDLVIARLDKLSRNEDVQRSSPCRRPPGTSSSRRGAQDVGDLLRRRGQVHQALPPGPAARQHHAPPPSHERHAPQRQGGGLPALPGALDADRFEGRFRDGVHQVDTSDLMRRMVKESLVKFDGRPLFPERIAYSVPYALSDAEAQLYTAGHRVRPRAVGPRQGARERPPRRHRRLRAHHPPATPRVITRGDLPVATPPPRAPREPAARARAPQARHHPRQPWVPAASLFDKDDLEDLEDAPDAELEEIEEQVLDEATAARTIDELRLEIDILKRLEAKPSRSDAAAATPSGRSSRTCSTRSSVPGGDTSRVVDHPMAPACQRRQPEARHLHRAPRHPELPQQRISTVLGTPERSSPSTAAWDAKRASTPKRRSATTHTSRCCSPPTPPAKASTSSART
jgi:hypothetical protein